MLHYSKDTSFVEEYYVTDRHSVAVDAAEGSIYNSDIRIISGIMLCR